MVQMIDTNLLNGRHTIHVTSAHVAEMRQRLMDDPDPRDFAVYQDHEVACEYVWQHADAYSVFDYVNHTCINGVMQITFDVERRVEPTALGHTSQFSGMNQLFSVTNSTNMAKRIRSNPNWWCEYHRLYRNARQSWTVVPVDVIAEKIRKRPDWMVADFGCGEHLLKNQLTNTVIGFDHWGVDDSVVVGDYLHVPSADNTFDAVVFSLSLPKLRDDLEAALSEAWRVVKPYGSLFIAEPTKRCDDDFGQLLANQNFVVISDVSGDKWRFVDAHAQK